VLFTLGLPRDLLLAALEPPSALRWIHSGSAGIRSLLHPELVASDVVLTNSAGIHAPPIAEAVIGMMLHFARGFDLAVRAQARREWDQEAFEQLPTAVRELGGATLGILGFGGIGREVAKRAVPLGMHVLAMRRRAVEGGPGDVELLRGDGALHQLLERSDFLVVSLPSTEETRGLLGRAELARLPRGAVLINVARGDVIDETALADALGSRHLRGAALDVFAKEPLAPSSLLWGLENILILPHVTATTPAFWRRQVDLIVENIGRYLKGRRLRNTVDKMAGY
jgi:phosphoglycerate dehydrogenase-like enzyme